MSSINFAKHTVKVFETIAIGSKTGGLKRKDIFSNNLESLTNQQIVNAIQNLKDRGYIRNVGGNHGSTAIYVICENKVVENRVLKSLDITKQIIAHSKAWPSGASLAPSMSDRPIYDGKELKQFDGRPGANDHMQCGSLVGGVVKPYALPSLRREQ